MISLEELKAEYVREFKKASKEDPSQFTIGWISAIGHVLGEDCPKVI
jgi:hypothetical protein